jgi:uncharacterized protein
MSHIRRVLNWPLTRLAITIGLFLLLNTIASWIVHNLLGIPRTVLVAQLRQLIIVYGVMIVVTRLIEHRPIATIGLRREGAVRELIAGFAIGTMAMSIAVGILALAGWYRVTTIASGASLFSILGYGLLLQLCVAVMEEGFARGVIFRITEEGLGSWLALVLSAVYFGMGHLSNPEATWWDAIAIMLSGGVGLGAAFMLTRNLWLAIGLHWAWNVVQGSVFGINVSGSNGLRASLLTPTIQGPDLWTGGQFGIEASLIT